MLCDVVCCVAVVFVLCVVGGVCGLCGVCCVRGCMIDCDGVCAVV